MFAPFSPDRLEQLATTKPLQRRYSDISTPSLSPTSTPELPPTHPDDPDDPSHLLLPVILSGVTHHSPSSLKTRSSALNSTHISNILNGEKQLLSIGEAALSTPGTRPKSATRAIAGSPQQYGAPASLPSAMALAHAHCAMHDLFACDAKLAPDSAYYNILAPFVGALTDWPAVVARPGDPDSEACEILGLPEVAGEGFALGLRCDSVCLKFGAEEPKGVRRGISLLPRMAEEDIVWSTSRSAEEGWFPWLFVEPLGLCGDVARGYINNLAAMRAGLAIYSRLYRATRLVRPTARLQATMFAYGIQTCGTTWRIYAMAEEGGTFPVTTIWSGTVDHPKHMVEATAIIRQIGAEAKARLQAVRSWMATICRAEQPSTPSSLPPGLPLQDILLDNKETPKLPPGIPIPGLTVPYRSSSVVYRSTPSSRNVSRSRSRPSSRLSSKHPKTQPPTRDSSPEPKSLKPWVPPFLPQHPTSAVNSPAPSRRPSPSPASLPPLKLGTTDLVLPGSYTTWARPASEADVTITCMRNPAPPPYTSHQRHPPPPAWQSQWRTPLRHPSPKPFQYSAHYSYSWPPLQKSPVWSAARSSSVTISHPKSHSRKVSVESNIGAGSAVSCASCGSCEFCGVSNEIA